MFSIRRRAGVRVCLCLRPRVILRQLPCSGRCCSSRAGRAQRWPERSWPGSRDGTPPRMTGRLPRHPVAAQHPPTALPTDPSASSLVPPSISPPPQSTPPPPLPVLAPGFGHQGAVVSDARAIYGSLVDGVIVSESRSILAAGPDGIADAVARHADQAAML